LHDFVFCKWHINQQAQANAANSCCQPCLRLKDAFQAIQGCCHAYVCLLTWSLIFLLQSMCSVRNLSITQHSKHGFFKFMQGCALVLRKTAIAHVSRCINTPQRSIGTSVMTLGENRPKLEERLGEELYHSTSKRVMLPMSMPVSVACAIASTSALTSPKPRLTPWPARGCTVCAASPIKASRGRTYLQS